jgi:hypothetical protein
VLGGWRILEKRGKSSDQSEHSVKIASQISFASRPRLHSFLSRPRLHFIVMAVRCVIVVVLLCCCAAVGSAQVATCNLIATAAGPSGLSGTVTFAFDPATQV